jgi:dGTPase
MEKSMSMEWQRLVSTLRLGRESDQGDGGSRTETMRDWDRLVYSSAFRRLQDKTQVFPLSDNDYVRTRLTHSIEVSSVGRSLGMLCGEFIKQKAPALTMASQDFGNIVAAACLAHDIGNPPFGHSGEAAIQSWFAEHSEDWLAGLSAQERQDFLRFEGNAQGFRLITRLQNAVNHGGFQLTYAVLAAFAKYPRPSHLPNSKERISEKKFSYFAHDGHNFEKIAEQVGLVTKAPGAWCRHPLAFVMEAADDICYGIVDLEDGHRLARVSFDEARNLLWPIAFPDGQAESGSYRQLEDDTGRIEYLRARAIGNLVRAALDVFRDNYDAIMDGRFEQDLAGSSRFAPQLKAISTLSRERIYATPSVLQIEAAGFEILGGLLDKIVPALATPAEQRSAANRKIAQIIPQQFARGESTYERLLGATDFISGMTDTYALKLFRRLNGIELPGTIF